MGLSSCISQRPLGDLNPITNERVEVSNASFERKVNGLGTTYVIGSTIAGGYLGYKQKWITNVGNGREETVTATNVTIGILSGFGFSMLTNQIVRGKKIKPIKHTTRHFSKEA